MPAKIGADSIAAIYIGNDVVRRVYIGSDIVFEWLLRPEAITWFDLSIMWHGEAITWWDSAFTTEFTNEFGV